MSPILRHAALDFYRVDASIDASQTGRRALGDGPHRGNGCGTLSRLAVLAQGTREGGGFG